MKNPKDGFLIGRAKSFRYAFEGAYLLLKSKHSIITQSLIAVILIIGSFLFHITKTEWLFQILSIGLILSIVGLNKAIEKLCKFIHLDYHKKVGFIKDISAGVVTFAALSAFAIVLIIYFPYLYEKVF